MLLSLHTFFYKCYMICLVRSQTYNDFIINISISFVHYCFCSTDRHRQFVCYKCGEMKRRFPEHTSTVHKDSDYKTCRKNQETFELTACRNAFFSAKQLKKDLEETSPGLHAKGSCISLLKSRGFRVTEEDLMEETDRTLCEDDVRNMPSDDAAAAACIATSSKRVFFPSSNEHSEDEVSENCDVMAALNDRDQGSAQEQLDEKIWMRNSLVASSDLAMSDEQMSKL